MRGAQSASLRRAPSNHEPVTSIELYFDLVYAFSITQLSHHLLSQPTWEGAWQTLVLLGAVWLVWVYTAWVTNWLDPQRLPVRLLLLALMLISLLFSAALPEAFGASGLLVAITFVVMQVGRTLFVVVALRGDRLQRNFERILAWSIASGCLWIVGAFLPVGMRQIVWALAIAVDLIGSAVGLYTPGLGRSRTLDWNIEGNHIAERCQAFILIALGESVVVIGATVASVHSANAAEIATFVGTFLGSALLWWLYFDRSAEEGARLIAASDDPGRLGRTAYHIVHPIMIAGIIVAAAADGLIIAHPTAVGDAPTAWMTLGGAALFLTGHALFKVVMWRAVSWSRVAAIIALALLGWLAPHVSALALGFCTLGILFSVALADWLRAHRATTAEEAATPPDDAPSHMIGADAS
jgi:low temperature requirement protein LtrA